MTSLKTSIARIPQVHDAERADALIARLGEDATRRDDLTGLQALLDEEGARSLLRSVLSVSPHLGGLMLRRPERILATLETDPDERFEVLEQRLSDGFAKPAAQAEAMRLLRDYKADVALLTGLADVAGVWGVETVTARLSSAADTALQHSVRFLLLQAAAKGELMPHNAERPEEGSGYIVVGMGKYGARELNYSSDIDLIVFFEHDHARLAAGVEPQPFFVRLTKALVRLMQEHTADGYVFRTDLRLRPDPGSTQVALSADAAMQYYESFGQNWERAALIKARAVAGDLEAGHNLIGQLAPFIWRKYLDYAAIADVHAMKRQVHAFKGFGEIGVAGHNIKLGRGGIREIEFFAQTQQLIAGGRQAELRTPRTLDALDRLAERDWITRDVAASLHQSYLFLRSVEHRLQMIADEQTHSLPDDPDKLLAVAHFCGYADTEAFSRDMRAHLESVQAHYGALFEADEQLTSELGNLVFTGDSDDPGTVETLAQMGFSNPSGVIQTVKGWHFGRYPAMRSARARESLTEFQPVLLDALAKTSTPDVALATFDRFLRDLPAGVQLFALLGNNPNLLRLIADIMGTAPRLARLLSRRRRTIEAVLDPGFFGALPAPAELAGLVESGLGEARDYQDMLDRARVIGHEQSFLIGVRVLSGTISASHAGHAYASLADALIKALKDNVECELARSHGTVADGAAAVLAMGKLGSQEMTASSDLDLIVAYDYDDERPSSDGAKPLSGGAYFARLTQRLVSALSAPTPEGTLYEVDMRLRPSGHSGPVATRLESFVKYQNEDAWTWEHMALTRARAVAGPEALCAAIEETRRRVLMAPRDHGRLVADVRDMRARMAEHKGGGDIWELKQVRGGLVDLEFIAQFLQLRHAHAHPEILDQNTEMALGKAWRAGVLAPGHGEVLIPATRLIQSLTQVLRLCLEGSFDAGQAPRGLKDLLARAGDSADFNALEVHLRDTLARVHSIFDEVIS